MKVGGAGRAQGPAGSGRAGKARSSNGERFRLDGAGQSDATQASGPVAAAAPVDALIALQEVDTATDGNRRAVVRAEAMLDVLDDIKLSLLAGGVSKEKLSQLLKLVEDRRDSATQFQDPRLAQVLDEIELRARVELAKYERVFAQ